MSTIDFVIWLCVYQSFAITMQFVVLYVVLSVTGRLRYNEFMKDAGDILATCVAVLLIQVGLLVVAILFSPIVLPILADAARSGVNPATFVFVVILTVSVGFWFWILRREYEFQVMHFVCFVVGGSILTAVLLPIPGAVYGSLRFSTPRRAVRSSSQVTPSQNPLGKPVPTPDPSLPRLDLHRIYTADAELPFYEQNEGYPSTTIQRDVCFLVTAKEDGWYGIALSGSGGIYEGWLKVSSLKDVRFKKPLHPEPPVRSSNRVNVLLKPGTAYYAGEGDTEDFLEGVYHDTTNCPSIQQLELTGIEFNQIYVEEKHLWVDGLLPCPVCEEVPLTLRILNAELDPTAY